MCTPEEHFINEIKHFFNNDTLLINDVSVKRINYLLGEYKSKISSIQIIDRVIYEPIKYIPLTNGQKKEASKISSLTIKKELIALAKTISNKHGLEYMCFMESKGRGKMDVRVARTEFCRTALKLLPISQEYLKDFLMVDHSTICYYIRGKRYRPTDELKNKFA